MPNFLVGEGGIFYVRRTLHGGIFREGKEFPMEGGVRFPEIV